MNYELAKQLKEAGFYQATWRGQNYFNEDGLAVISDEFLENERMQGKIKIPSLSELIESCGDKFEWLGNYGVTKYGHQDDIGKTVWVCGKWSGTFVSVGDDFDEISRGSTPEEAVANLWLKINK